MNFTQRSYRHLISFTHKGRKHTANSLRCNLHYSHQTFMFPGVTQVSTDLYYGMEGGLIIEEVLSTLVPLCNSGSQYDLLLSYTKKQVSVL